MKVKTISYQRSFLLKNGEYETVSIEVEPVEGDGVYHCELNSVRKLWSELKGQAEQWHQENTTP